MWLIDYLVKRGSPEMVNWVGATNMFQYKPAQSLTDDTKILENQEARDKLYLHEPVLPSNTLKVPVWQEFVPLYFCGATDRTFRSTVTGATCQEHNYGIDMGTTSGTVTWNTGTWVSGSLNSLRFRLYYPYTDATAFYDQTWTSASPPPATISWTYTYSGGSGQVVRIRCTCS